MTRRTELRPGDVISFRVPQNISSVDLDYLNQVAGRNTEGKAGAIAGFFFRRLEQARVETGIHASVTLPPLNQYELQQLENPLFQRALSIFACQLLGRGDDHHNGRTARSSQHVDLQEEEESANQHLGSAMTEQPDPAAVALFHKLSGA
ncbi:hypothetical protein [Alicyclobacillus sp. ALC3]|uniref:hypothetical protein n=1 Tax=Alicyclobacillus sp. ALC3 TaxID=2796143 RepID=UPI002379F3AD|nr:hypothetical protein [Alicyclobacillus sp. ALC3]WDL99799.1 hypothetical protein JC200_23805 [Alicyclobacillus sp. ALC3]